MNMFFHNLKSDYWKINIKKIQKKFDSLNIVEGTLAEYKELGEIDYIITTRLTFEQLNKMTKLKMIFAPVSGLNKFPLEEIKKRNIKIFNAKGDTRYIAERALALTLTLLGRIVEAHKNLENGVWKSNNGKNHYWTSMRNKKCGILGMGRIGINIADMLKIFDCEIIGYRSDLTKEKPKQFLYQTDDLVKIVKESDIIFIALPLTENTLNLIDEDILNLMKDKYIINVGRGNIINEKALYEALKNNIIAGVALDVWFNYPDNKQDICKPSKYEFNRFYNIVMSPHAATHTKKAKESYIDEIIQKILVNIK
ncbi:MAG: NAD(P)-dependent oxidoreductase [Clostridium sp.]